MIFLGFEIIGLIFIYYGFKKLIIDSNTIEIHSYYNYQPPPLYDEIDGWKENISDIIYENKLPKNFIKYLKYLEEKLKVPIAIISVGPDRKQTIIRENFKTNF